MWSENYISESSVKFDALFLSVESSLSLSERRRLRVYGKFKDTKIQKNVENMQEYVKYRKYSTSNNT